jgi:hypothetical protein
MSALIMFRDWDPLYKPPFYNKVSWREYNKTGYVSKTGWVVYPYGRSVTAKRLGLIAKRRHTLVPLDFMSKPDDVETFFTQNKPNAELFFQGLNALGRRDNEFFEYPIRLPILPPTNPQEFEERWQRMLKIVCPSDCIMIFDTTSYISKIIAAVDRGVWSHVGGYAGNGKILELILSGMVERPLDIYRSPRYRIGIYRPRLSNGDVYDEDNLKRIKAFLAYERASIGRTRYNYLKVVKLGFFKTFGIQLKQPSDYDVTPNDMARSAQLKLIFTI